MAKIIGVNSENAGFSVKFPNGLEGEPVVHFEDLHVDAEGEKSLKAFFLAAAKWLNDNADRVYYTDQEFFSSPEGK